MNDPHDDDTEPPADDTAQAAEAAGDDDAEPAEAAADDNTERAEAAGDDDADRAEAAGDDDAEPAEAARDAAAEPAEAAGDDDAEPAEAARDDDTERAEAAGDDDTERAEPDPAALEDAEDALSADDGAEGEPADEGRKSLADDPAALDAVIEALLLCSRDPLTPVRVRDVLKAEGEPVDVADVRAAFERLRAAWEAEERPLGRGFRLVEVGGGFCFRTHADTGRFVRRFYDEKPSRLSRAALEALAIIAYRQPLTRPQIDEIRGVDSSGALKNLIDRGLIRILGKSDDVGRPLIYGTTKAFLEFFNLRTLNELPTLREYQLLNGEGEIGPKTEVREGGPVRVMDLFDPTSSGELISEQTEQESENALAALEQALGQATQITRRATAVADGGMDEIPLADKPGDDAAPVEATSDAAQAPPDDAPAADALDDEAAATAPDLDEVAPVADEAEAAPAADEALPDEPA